MKAVKGGNMAKVYAHPNSPNDLKEPTDFELWKHTVDEEMVITSTGEQLVFSSDELDEDDLFDKVSAKLNGWIVQKESELQNDHVDV